MNLHRPFPTAPLVALLIALLATLPAHAQYKVVGPDGKVTYTDRPPTSTEGKVSPITAKGGTAPAASDAGLPAELRAPTTRYPVVLYTATGACEICTSARQFLRQRGIPYAEKQVLSSEDSEALQRLSGGRDVPTLTIGSQTLRGLAPDVWGSYLDAAGYPRESRLPANYQFSTPTPIVARAARAGEAPAAATTPAPAPDAPADATPNPTGIKF